MKAKGGSKITHLFEGRKNKGETMSRGLGKVQKAILEILESSDGSKLSLSSIAFDLNWPKHCVNETAYPSVSRAVSRLEKLGYVKKSREYDKGCTEHDDIFGCVFVELVKR